MAKSDALFVTDAALAERIGLSTEQIKSILPTLSKAGFPTPDPLFENRRYWPAVKVWLDRRYGMGDGRQSYRGLDGKESWK